MKPYALLLLSNLDIKKFDNIDDMKTAIQTLTKNGKVFLALKWHEGANNYFQLTVW